MLLAHQIAHWSKESGRRVGAVIVGPDKEIRSTGFNGFPRGVRDDIPERHSRETGAKYLWSSHAERNAIYNAARIGVSVKGCVMYVPWYPCVECAKAIIQSGICEVVSPCARSLRTQMGPGILAVGRNVQGGRRQRTPDPEAAGAAGRLASDHRPLSAAD